MQCLNLITSPLCRPTSWRGSIHLFQPLDSPHQRRKLRWCSSEWGQGGGCKQDLLPPLGPSMGLFLCKSIQAQGGCWTLSLGHFFAKTAPVSGSVSISETCYVACLAKNIHPHTANWVLPQGVVSFQNGPSNLVL